MMRKFLYEMIYIYIFYIYCKNEGKIEWHCYCRNAAWEWKIYQPNDDDYYGTKEWDSEWRLCNSVDCRKRDFAGQPSCYCEDKEDSSKIDAGERRFFAGLKLKKSRPWKLVWVILRLKAVRKWGIGIWRVCVVVKGWMCNLCLIQCLVWL